MTICLHVDVPCCWHVAHSGLMSLELCLCLQAADSPEQDLLVIIYSHDMSHSPWDHVTKLRCEL